MVLAGLLLLLPLISPATAQQTETKPSVMERIREKARQKAPMDNRNWFDRLDPNRSGYIPKATVESAIRQRFSLLDLNHDGAIDRAEYARRSTTQLSPGLAFDLLDGDRDGRLSMAEFAAPVMWRFDRLDSDGDGMISREEAARYLSTPASRSIPPLTGTCFEIDGRLVTVAPDRVEALQREGRRSADCAWKPNSPPLR